MAPVLIGATVLFGVLAIVMSLVASKAMRDNRARSAARIAALQAVVAAASSEKPAPRVLAAQPPAPTLVLNSKFEFPNSVEHALFEDSVPRTPGRRWTWTIAAGLMMASAVGIIYIISTGVLARVAMAKNATAIAAAASPIELLSLRHSTDTSGNFVVTGLVQNPAASTALHGVFAVAYLFDADGNYFASSKAQIESAVLSPGGEAAFVVRVPASASSPTPVSRYRISFQQEDGAAVNHIDRRGSLPAGTTGDTVDMAGSTTTSLVSARKIG